MSFWRRRPTFIFPTIREIAPGAFADICCENFAIIFLRESFNLQNFGRIAQSFPTGSSLLTHNRGVSALKGEVVRFNRTANKQNRINIPSRTEAVNCHFWTKIALRPGLRVRLYDPIHISPLIIKFERHRSIFITCALFNRSVANKSEIVKFVLTIMRLIIRERNATVSR